MLSSCLLLAPPNPRCSLLFHMPGFGGDLVVPAYHSIPLHGLPSCLMCCSCPESWEAALMLFVVQDDGIQCACLDTANKKSIQMGPAGVTMGICLLLPL